MRPEIAEHLHTGAERFGFDQLSYLLAGVPAAFDLLLVRGAFGKFTLGGADDIEGVIETDIMYSTDENSSSVDTHRHRQNFSHTFEISHSEENMVCDVHADIVHSSYTISVGSEIDLRFVLQIDTDVLSHKNIEYITSLTRDEEKSYDEKKSYCIKIYFAKAEDSLWSIAKRHKITQKSLMEINNISCDSEIFDGKQLMIPIK